MLIKNYLLEEIAEKLTVTPFPFIEAVKQFVEDRMPYNKHQKSNNLKWTEITGGIAELGVRLNLIEISKEYAEHIVVDPITTNKSIQDYLFHWNYTNTSNRTLNVSRKFSKDNFEYDTIIIVDKLPVLVEVKTISARSMKLSSRIHKNFNTIMDPATYERKIHPLQVYFSSPNIGYLIVTPSDTIKYSSPVQQTFKDNKGIITPFPINRDTYHLNLAKVFLEELVK